METRKDPEFVWDEPSVENVSYQLIFSENTAVFEIFSLKDDINIIRDELNDHLKPFLDFYPWSNLPPSFSVYKKGDVPYIYGELTYDLNINDEWVITALLWSFSKKFNDIFIHVFDSSDFEFLLVEAAELCPEWLEPSNAFNRIWINSGTILLINPDKRSDALKLNEALSDLFDANFQKYKAISEFYTSKFDGILGKYYFDLVYEVDVLLSDHAFSLICHYPWLISKSISEFSRTGIINPKNSERKWRGTTFKQRNVALPLLAYKQIELKQTKLLEVGTQIDFTSLVSLSIEEGINSIESSEDWNNFYKGTAKDVSRNAIVQNFIRLGLIPNNIDIDVSILSENKPDAEPGNSSDDVEAMDRFKKFFEDNEAGIDGAENDKTQKSSGLSSDIDEDDFFEFFLKEALKLSDDEIQGFRSDATNERPKQKRKIHTLKEYNDDSDYETDTSTEYTNTTIEKDDDNEDPLLNESEEEGDAINMDDLAYLKELLNSLKMEEGPGNVLLSQIMEKNTKSG
ncbi:Piso0_004011 [Millerozyma farinosa CBS 7064]|uniref:Piso0_004011 protein n=1 Tax=Pichia sorbitophila (strain ATCC MYA-4447 / BCRC 22081 / CBS 7064 / NBRC 10061 / NRRL Y-12695) TaxID=559304 RepID=G8YA53_PICSO|nr:Piso0_004011 [Millerozyma farinosa CBS 7064]CCE84467.1 Piso0_004011 [Millerozyma farinosa CBS 7064]